MKLDSVTNQVFIVAFNEAKIRQHEYITPEHFLYAALLFDAGKELLENSGGNVSQMIDDLTVFFKNNMDKVEDTDPIETFEFIAMSEAASIHVRSASKDTVTLGDLLISIFTLRESYAVYILNKNGVNRGALVKHISHGTVTPKSSIIKSDDITNKEYAFLQTYTVDLTKKAFENELDPLIGRQDILDRTIQVLCRRFKNNPVHIGDPGVGKTAITEGLAQRIIQGNVPDMLKNSKIFYLDLGSVVAGTKYRGDFEERFIKLLEIISKEQNPIIYLDEIHTVVGTGSISGSAMDATSILKPHLLRGNLKIIGSTTYEEYKKYFEKDRALARRFQKIEITEPSIEDCIEILKGIKKNYESFHHVVFPDKVIALACELSGKYLQDRRLPDKAIDVIDETGAYVRMRAGDDREPTTITADDIERTISLMAKIPLEKITQNEMDKLKNLETTLKSEIFGQDNAIETVVNAIKASRSGINDSERPVSNLLFVGPTGVGKTEVAKQLAIHLGIKLQRFDMSEYQEKHSVAKLIGAPAGYVGFDEGGILTEAINKTPYCVLLLDEIEKAHADILNVLLQVMDYGSLTDNVGKKTDFRNVILVMTSNAGARDMSKNAIGFEERRLKSDVVTKEVERIFSPEFINRLDEVILFNNISKDMSLSISEKAVLNLGKRLIDKKVKLKPTPQAYAYIARKGLSEKYGAREINRVVEQEIKKKLVNEILFGKLTDGGTVIIDATDTDIKLSIRGSRKTR